LLERILSSSLPCKKLGLAILLFSALIATAFTHSSQLTGASQTVLASETVTIYAIADSYVNSSSSNANYGSSGELRMEFDSHQAYIYIMFDISSIPPYATILSANLSLYMTDVSAEGPWGMLVTGVHRCLDNTWNEYEINWSNKPGFEAEATSTTSFGPIVILNVYKKWNVTEDVKHSLGVGKLTEVLKFKSTEVYGDFTFQSREASHKPYLAVAYYTPPVYHLDNFPNTHRDNVNSYLVLPACTGKDPTVGLPVWNASVSDWTAAGFVGGLLQYEKVRYDTDPNIVDQTTGEPVLASGSGLVLFGGPLVDQPVYYYEVNKIAPVVYCAVPGAGGSGEPWSQWYRRDGTAITESAMGTTDHLDLFLVELFCDDEGRFVFIVYGVGWKGSLAGGIYFDQVIYPDMNSYTNSWYIFKWDDDGDGNVEDPTEDTYTLLATGN